MSQEKWDKYFIKMAHLVATKSKDESTKCGAVIVGPNHEIRSTGYNDFPRGVKDDIPERRQRPIKYLFTEHAERNAVYNAARVGIALEGCVLYLNCEPCPCADCARAVIQSGLVAVIGPDIKFPGKGKQWKASMKATREMFTEAGITTITGSNNKRVKKK